MSRLLDVLETYQGSDAERTKRLYAELEAQGPIGVIAMNLLRAEKASERAKAYRGRRFKGSAYDKKQWSLDNACAALLANPIGLVWGWGIDPVQPVHCHVLYVDLPSGQISFHGGWRGKGPDYPGKWDGRRGASVERVVTWAALVLDGRGVEQRVGVDGDDAADKAGDLEGDAGPVVGVGAADGFDGQSQMELFAGLGQAAADGDGGTRGLTHRQNIGAAGADVESRP